MAITALILAAAIGGSTTGPLSANPRLMGIFTRPPGATLMADLGQLAADGVPGADAMHRGFAALLSGSDGPNWVDACAIWDSASGTDAVAAHFTAECEEKGTGRPANTERAADLYRRAGEAGFAKSKCALGNLYRDGRGVPADPARGVALCREGADMGDADAQTDLGNYYLHGDGVGQDYAEARRWFEKAAAQRQRNALFNLGAMAWNGHGGPRDLEAAGQWFEGAYAAGRRDAATQVARGTLLRAVPNAPEGPVDADLLAHARRWYEIALERDPSEQGRADAAVALAQISGYEAMLRAQSDNE